MRMIMMVVIMLLRLQGAVEEGEGATLLTLTLLEATVKNCGFVIIIIIIISTIVIIILSIIIIIISSRSSSSIMTMTQG